MKTAELFEMPRRISGGDIDKFSDYVYEPVFTSGTATKLGKNVFSKISKGHQYYWFGTSTRPTLFTILKGGSIVITLKDPKLKKGPPYATDLYRAIVAATRKPLKSDDMITKAGLSIWKRLIASKANVTFDGDRITSVDDIPDHGQLQLNP